MPNLSLGTIEVFGLPAAIAAADIACKTANVSLIGYESTDGMGMVTVKIEGQVSAVQAAVAAASAAAAGIGKVFASSVIARPSDQLDPVVRTEATVGLAKPEPVAAPVAIPAPEPVALPTQALVEPTPQPIEVTPVVTEGAATDDAGPAGDVTLPVPQDGPTPARKPRSIRKL